MNKKKEIIILFLAVLIGIFLRFFKLGQNPAAIYWDEAAIGLDAYSISQTGLDMNNMSWLQPVMGSYGDFKAPVLIWLTSLSVKAFGMNTWAIRLPVAIFSVLSIVLVYFLLKELLSFDQDLEKKYKLVPILAAILTAISPWPVHFGRIAFESSLSVAFLLLALIFFLKALKNKNIFFFLSTFFAALAVYAYYSLRVIVPLFCLALVIVFFKKAKDKKLPIIISMLLFVLAVVPILRSPYYARSQEYRLNNDNLIHHRKIIEESSKYLEQYGSQPWAKLIYHRYIFLTRDFLINMGSHFTADFLFFSGDQNLRQHSGYLGELFLVSLPFYYLGLFLLFKNIKSKTSQFLLVFMALSPIPAAMVYEVPHASRAIYLFVPFLVLTAIGLNEVMNQTKKIVWWLILFAFMANAGFYYADYFIDYPARSSEAWLYTYNEATLYLKEHRDEFSEVDIDEHYWFPRIFVYYQFPELLDQTRELKNAMLNSPINSFGLADPFKYLFNKEETTKKKAKFIYYEAEIPEGYQVEKEFNFLNGDKSLILVTKQ